MKASVKNYKIIIIVFVLFLQMFLHGCGGSSGHSANIGNLYTISGRVILSEPDTSVRLNNGQNASEKITVRLEQQPTISTTCDENGCFTLNFPKITENVNLIAFKGTINNRNDFWLQRSDDILLSNETSINAGDMQLTQGKNTFCVQLSDVYINPIEYAKCTFWGFDIYSDPSGLVSFPLFPDNISKVKATINANGLSEFTNEFSVFTNDLGPVTDLVIYTYSDKNRKPIVINLDKFNSEPDSNQQVDISIKISDESKIFIDDDYQIGWYCTEGKFLKDYSNDKNIWQAPSYDCLATITVGIFNQNYYSAVRAGIAVGKSRKIYSKIDFVSPLEGAAGQIVRIFGKGFTNNIGEVYFKDSLAKVVSWSDEEICVVIPDEAETGKLTLKIENRTLTTDEDFVCLDYKTTLSNNYGLPGAEITISGYGFGDTKADNSYLLYNNEKIDNIILWNNTNIKFKVEELSGATPHTANLDLVIRGRKRSLGKFSVSYIKKISPQEATHYTYESEVEKTVITLTGVGFGSSEEKNINSVSFLTYVENNEKEYVEAEVKSWSDDEIEVYLPTKAQTGNILLKINGYEMLGPVFTVIPASDYSELIEARFSDVLNVTNSLITGVIVESSDRVYLCDPQNYRLWYLEDGEYKYISMSDAANVYCPQSGAITKNGEIILAVADTEKTNRKLIKLVNGSITQKSSYVFTGFPMGLCVASTTGYIYVSDSEANKIIVFDENLAKIDEFGEEGSKNGMFLSPSGICLNKAETSIFVADSGNHRVQQFDISSDSEDKKEYKFNCWYGSCNGNNGRHTDANEFGEKDDEILGFYSPSSVACDGSYLYVVDSGRNDIQKINIAISTLPSEVFGESGNGDSQFMSPTDIKLFENKMYIADSENSRLQIISKTGAFDSIQKPEISGMNVSFLGISMNSDKDAIYIVDAVDCSISKFDTYGTFEKKIGSKGNGVGQLLNPSDVLLDKYNNIWVADTDNKRLVMFPADGGETKNFGSGGSGKGQFKSIQRLACDSNNNIFVSDCENNVVLKFNDTGEYLYSIGQAELKQPFGLAVDSSDNLYVCDAGHYRICKYDANNQFVGWFGLAEGQEAGGWHDANEVANGKSGSAVCQFDKPIYLDIDAYDALYVLDYGSKRIQKFDTKNTGILGGHICSVDVDTDMYGIAVDDKDCFFITTDSFVRKYVPAP